MKREDYPRIREGQHLMSSTRKPPLIVVIEDDAAILRGLTFNLEAEGYRVKSASDGALGLSLLESEEPDVLILDLMLPEVSGYEICRKLRDEGRDTTDNNNIS